MKKTLFILLMLMGFLSGYAQECRVGRIVLHEDANTKYPVLAIIQVCYIDQSADLMLLGAGFGGPGIGGIPHLESVDFASTRDDGGFWITLEQAWNLGVPINKVGNWTLDTVTLTPPVTPVDFDEYYFNGNQERTLFPELFSGDYDDLTDKPTLNISNWNTSFGWGNHASAGYLTSFTETDPQFNTKFSGKSTSDLSEGTNLYYTTARFNTSFGGKSTTDLTEGTNLYYTVARFNTAFSGKSSTDLAEGTNLYFTNARSRSAISLTTTGSSGAATYSNSTGVLNIPNYTPAAPTFNNNVSRSLSNAAGSTNQYTISTTQYAAVNYSINVAWSVVLNTFTGQVFLEYSTNSGSSWNTVNQCTRSQASNLTSNGSDDLNLTGVIPANALVRLRTTQTNCTVTYNLGQEVLH